MPFISEKKEEKVCEQILYYLFSVFPRQVFISDISRELARDEEFIKRLLFVLEKRGLVQKISKSPSGINYLRRLRWRISNRAYDVYKGSQ